MLVSGVQQSESVIYIDPLFLRFFSHIGHYRVLSRVPCAIHTVGSLFVIYFMYSSMYMSIPISQFIFPHPLPPGNHKFVFYICNSISVFLLFATTFLPQTMKPLQAPLFSHLYPQVKGLSVSGNRIPVEKQVK